MAHKKRLLLKRIIPLFFRKLNRRNVKLWLILAATPFAVFGLAVLYGYSNINKSVVNIDDYDPLHDFNDDNVKVSVFHIQNNSQRGFVLPPLIDGQNYQDNTGFNLMLNIQYAKQSSAKIFHFELLKDKIRQLTGSKQREYIPNLDSLEKNLEHKISDQYPKYK